MDVDAAAIARAVANRGSAGNVEFEFRLPGERDFTLLAGSLGYGGTRGDLVRFRNQPRDA